MESDAARLRSEPDIREPIELATDAPSSFDIRYWRFVAVAEPLPRTEITKKVWEYIQAHHLQDPQNRRNINADDKLQALFGGKAQAAMFELTKFVSQHIA